MLDDTPLSDWLELSEVDDWSVLVDDVDEDVDDVDVVAVLSVTVQATSVAPATPATAIPVVTSATRRRPVSRVPMAQP